MLTGGQFYDVLSAVVPLYVALFLGYGSLKWWRVVTPEQSAGISRFNALVAMPALVFEIIAFNDPYTMNNRLIAAYCLSNGVVLGERSAHSGHGCQGQLVTFVIAIQSGSCNHEIRLL
jgi:auxin efflux carrier family